LTSRNAKRGDFFSPARHPLPTVGRFVDATRVVASFRESREIYRDVSRRVVDAQFFLFGTRVSSARRATGDVAEFAPFGA